MNYWTLELDEDVHPCEDKSTDNDADPNFFWVCSDLKPTDPCSIPMDPGTCDGTVRRFAYNPVTKRCQGFSYSGCGGNENNFTLRKSCIAKCIKGQRGMTVWSVVEMCLSLIFSWKKLNVHMLLFSGAAHRKKIIRIRKKNIDYIVNRPENHKSV